MLSSCFTQPVTLCSALANSVSFLIHPPAEPNEQEKQKSKVFLSLDPVLLVLEGLDTRANILLRKDACFFINSIPDLHTVHLLLAPRL